MKARVHRVLSLLPPLALVCLPLVSPAARPDDASRAVVVRDVVYGKGGGRDLHLDLFLPAEAGQRRPAMVFIHGGGWRGGNRGQFESQSMALARMGVVCACIEYRLSGEAKFPAAVEDAKCAVRWLRARAGELLVAPERIGCAGGSAGGHIAAMLAVTADDPRLEGKGGHEEQSSAVSFAVIFNGVTDMNGFDADRLARPASLVAQFLGGRPDEIPETYRLASPVTQVDSKDPPCLLFHGDADKTVPYEQSRVFARALKDAGVEARLVTAEGADHGYFNRGRHYEETLAELQQYAAEHFALGGAVPTVVAGSGTIEFFLDRKRLVTLGIAVGAVTKALEEFTAKHPDPSLEEFSSVTVDGPNGERIPLREIGSLKVVRK